MKKKQINNRFSAVTSVIANATNTFSYAYLPGSGLIATVSNNLEQVVARSYETHRDLITSVENIWGTNIISRFDYTNDALGRRTARQDAGVAFASTWTNLFAYNVRSEIEEAIMRNGPSEYEFDPIGNRREVTLPEEPTPYVYQSNELNQYTSITNGIASVPIHDEDGNMLSGPAGTGHTELQFAWDGENRLVAVTNGSIVVLNSYDAQSRWVRKQVLENGSPATDVRFLYDGWSLTRSVTLSNDGASTNFYTWGLDLSQSVQGAGGVGGLLSVTISTSSTNQTYSTCFDANGNISEYLDLGTGGIAAHLEYDAFGRTIVSTGTAPCAFGFSTKYEDAETGLLYYGYRFYSPELGRWPSRDPIGEVGGNNLYACCRNDLNNRIDLRGLAYDPYEGFSNAWDLWGGDDQGGVPEEWGSEWEANARKKLRATIRDWRKLGYNYAADLMQAFLDRTGHYSPSQSNIEEVKTHGKSQICKVISKHACASISKNSGSVYVQISPKDDNDSNIRWLYIGYNK
ncbi:MAG: RHS repeat-associated core domain-containing protein, partial [Kiritimatiellia bacterium]|nr:RHS repeat-associated core domain-containing protein [Kiritimatiellia bacterium]